MSYVEPLVQSCVGAVSHIVERDAQSELLDRTKTVLEGAAQLVLAAKHAAGNPRVSQHAMT